MQNTSWLKAPNQSAQGTHNYKRLRASSPKPPAPTMGEQNRTWHRTVGSGAVAEGLEKGRTSCQSDTRQDSSRHVLGVQAWPKIRSTSAKPGVGPDAICPLQDNQRIRSDDSHSRTGLCNRM